MAEKVKELHQKIVPNVKEIAQASWIVCASDFIFSDTKTKEIEKSARGFLLNNGLYVTEREHEGTFKMVLSVSMKNYIKVDEQEDKRTIKLIIEKRELILTTSSEEDWNMWRVGIRHAQEGVLPPKFKEGENGEKVWDPLGNEDPEQLKVFYAFKEKIEKREPPLRKAQKAFVDDACLLRYLRARQYNLENSLKMLEETLKWRDEYKPHLIDSSEVESELKCGKWYASAGTDKLGRPIVYLRPSLDLTEHSETKVKGLVTVVEDACERCESKTSGVEKTVWLVDFSKTDKRENAAGKMKDGITTAVEIVKLFQNHYPERLGRAFLIFAPAMFQMVWKVLSPFIDPVTHRKVIFIKKQSDMPEMLDYFWPDQLEEQFGGSVKERLQYEDWKAWHDKIRHEKIALEE